MVFWTGVLAGTEGMDAFLRALDVGMLKRTVATKFVEGLNGKLKIKIQQEGNSIKFTTFGPSDPDGVTNEFTIGKCDNINENPFLGEMIADLHWEVSTEGRRALVADMKGEDGKSAQLRRSLIGDADQEMLLMETIVNGASMSQRYQCESRPVRAIRAATARSTTNRDAAGGPGTATCTPTTHEAETGGHQQANDELERVPEDQQTMQPSFETCTVHLDYIQSKFPWPLSSEYSVLLYCLA